MCNFWNAKHTRWCRTVGRQFGQSVGSPDFINRPARRSIGMSARRRVGVSVGRRVGESVGPSVGIGRDDKRADGRTGERAAGQASGRAGGRSVGPSVGVSAGRSANMSVCARMILFCDPCSRFTSRLTNHQGQCCRSRYWVRSSHLRNAGRTRSFTLHAIARPLHAHCTPHCTPHCTL